MDRGLSPLLFDTSSRRSYKAFLVSSSLVAVLSPGWRTDGTSFMVYLQGKNTLYFTSFSCRIVGLSVSFVWFSPIFCLQTRYNNWSVTLSGPQRSHTLGMSSSKLRICCLSSLEISNSLDFNWWLYVDIISLHLSVFLSILVWHLFLNSL